MDLNKNCVRIILLDKKNNQNLLVLSYRTIKSLMDPFYRKINSVKGLPNHPKEIFVFFFDYSSAMFASKELNHSLYNNDGLIKAELIEYFENQSIQKRALVELITDCHSSRLKPEICFDRKPSKVQTQKESTVKENEPHSANLITSDQSQKLNLQH